MAAGMILSVSWGTDESRMKDQQTGEPGTEVDDKGLPTEQEPGSRKDKQRKTRTEFEING